MAKISITVQPADKKSIFGAVAETTGVTASAGAQTITYVWKIATKADLSDAKVVAGQTTNTLTLPVAQLSGTYFVFCDMTANTYEATRTASAVWVVEGKLPQFPSYITGAFVHEYLNNSNTRVREKFEGVCARTGIVIPNDDKVLRTAQVELFTSVL